MSRNSYETGPVSPTSETARAVIALVNGGEHETRPTQGTTDSDGGNHRCCDARLSARLGELVAWIRDAALDADSRSHDRYGGDYHAGRAQALKACADSIAHRLQEVEQCPLTNV